MAKPVGVAVKTKDNSKKHPRAHEEWQKGKRIGRPKQEFDKETNSWRKLGK